MQEAGKIIHLIPEYFPRVSTMMRLVGVSECVLHPEVQYSRQSWQNRTKIRNPDGWQWLTVPLEARHLGDAIADTAILPASEWATRHLKGLKFNYSTSPFHLHYIDEVEELIRTAHDRLGPLTVASVKLSAKLLGLGVSFRIAESDEAFLASESPSFKLDPRQEYAYRQNFEGFIPGMSVLDILFNHGPEAVRLLQP